MDTDTTILKTGRPSEFPPMAPGIYYDIPEERYHGGPEVSVSALKDFARAPLAAIASEPEQTKALVIGDVVHTAILTPRLVQQKFHVHDLARVSEREAATQAELRKAAGKIMVKRKDYDEAMRMADAVHRQSSLIRDLLTDDLETEVSAYFNDPETGLPCRMRADVKHNGFRLIADLKTAEDATEAGFARAVANYKYHWQAYFYRRGLPLAGGFEPQAFLFIVVEKSAPYLTGIYEIEPRAMEVAADHVQHHMRRWAECAQTGIWPGLPGDRPTQLALPAWAYTAG